MLAVSGLGVNASVKRTLNRIGGTVVGFVIALVVASVVDSEAVLIGVALVLAVVVVVVMLSVNSYLLFEAFVVPVVVLLTSTSIADVEKTDAARLAAVLIGGALVLLATGITLGWAHYQPAHNPPADSETCRSVAPTPPSAHRQLSADPGCVRSRHSCVGGLGAIRDQVWASTPGDDQHLGRDCLDGERSPATRAHCRAETMARSERGSRRAASRRRVTASPEHGQVRVWFLCVPQRFGSSHRQYL